MSVCDYHMLDRALAERDRYVPPVLPPFVPVKTSTVLRKAFRDALARLTAKERRRAKRLMRRRLPTLIPHLDRRAHCMSAESEPHLDSLQLAVLRIAARKVGDFFDNMFGLYAPRVGRCLSAAHALTPGRRRA